MNFKLNFIPPNPTP